MGFQSVTVGTEGLEIVGAIVPVVSVPVVNVKLTRMATEAAGFALVAFLEPILPADLGHGPPSAGLPRAAGIMAPPAASSVAVAVPHSGTVAAINAGAGHAPDVALVATHGHPEDNQRPNQEESSNDFAR